MIPSPKLINAILHFFPADQHQTALAIVLQESGGDHTVKSKSGKYKGAWQLGPDHPVDPFDPIESTEYAASLYKKLGWQPWGAYNSGKYKRKLPEAGRILSRI